MAEVRAIAEGRRGTPKAAPPPVEAAGTGDVDEGRNMVFVEGNDTGTLGAGRFGMGGCEGRQLAEDGEEEDPEEEDAVPD